MLRPRCACLTWASQPLRGAFTTLMNFVWWKLIRLIHIRNVAALRLHQHAELFKRTSIGNSFLSHLATFIQIFRLLANHQHICTNVQTMLAKIIFLGPPPFSVSIASITSSRLRTAFPSG